MINLLQIFHKSAPYIQEKRYLRERIRALDSELFDFITMYMIIPEIIYSRATKEERALFEEIKAAYLYLSNDKEEEKLFYENVKNRVEKEIKDKINLHKRHLEEWGEVEA